MRLRSHLLLMTVATVTPVIVAAVIVVSLLVQRERATVENAAMDRVVAVMTAIDADLRGTMTTLLALAASSHLERGDLRAFHADLVRILKSQPDWLNVNLALPSGARVADGMLPFDAALPPVGERRSFDLVVQNAAPIISDLSRADIQQSLSVAIRVPVIRSGRVVYVLSAVLNVDTLEAVLRAQRLPEGWVVALVDRNYKFIARVPPQPLGQEAASSFRAAIERAPQGWFGGETVEGYRTYTPYVTSAVSGWVLGIAMPRDAVDGSIWRTLWAMIGLVLLALGMAVALALLLGRRIATPIASLTVATEASGRGEVAAFPGSASIAEVDALGAVLKGAAQAMREKQELAEREKQ